ncbi:MAG: FAD-dependent oxidoreductase [Lentisphaeria bacterium]
MKFSLNYDVVVCGAGVAGVAAAVQAARRGQKVALVEKQNLIGGLACSGLIHVYLPLCDGNGNQVISGIAEEMLLKSQEFSPFRLSKTWGGNGIPRRANRDRYEVEFSPAALTITLDEMLLEAGVELWLDSRVCDIQQNQQRIEAVIVENVSGRGKLQAKCFIDASGDATILRLAGGEFVTEDNSLSFWLLERSPNAEKLYHFTDQIHMQTFRFPPEQYQPGSGLDGLDYSSYTRQAWRQLRQFYRDSYSQGNDSLTHYPLQLPAMPQYRKTAAAQCLYMLDDQDEQRSFTDSVGLTGDWRKPGPVWETPLRSLIPVQHEALFMAGRCIGAINQAWEVYRVIPTAAMTGQAAGMAAALCNEQNCGTRQLEPALLQAELRKNKIKLHKSQL